MFLDILAWTAIAILGLLIVGAIVCVIIEYFELVLEVLGLFAVLGIIIGIVAVLKWSFERVF